MSHTYSPPVPSPGRPRPQGSLPKCVKRSMLYSLGQHDSDLSTVFSRWDTGSTTHRMHHDGSYAHSHASSGIDQGCRSHHAVLQPPSNPPHGSSSRKPVVRSTAAHLDQAATHPSSYPSDLGRHPCHQPRAAAQQDPDLDSIMPEPYPARFPRQGQINGEVSGRSPPHRWRQLGQLRGAGRPTHHEHCHAPLPKHLGHPTRLNQAGLKMQTVNDLLTMYVGDGSRHALRMTFVPETEADSFDAEIVAFWSQLIGRDATCHCFTSRFARGLGGWARRTNDTPLPHGQLGSQSSLH